MATKMGYSNETENKAIIEKVAKVLKGTDYPTKKTIIIESDGESIPTIRYNITELIVPESVAYATEVKGEGND